MLIAPGIVSGGEMLRQHDFIDDTGHNGYPSGKKEAYAYKPRNIGLMPFTLAASSYRNAISMNENKTMNLAREGKYKTLAEVRGVFSFAYREVQDACLNRSVILSKWRRYFGP